APSPPNRRSCSITASAPATSGAPSRSVRCRCWTMRGRSSNGWASTPTSPTVVRQRRHCANMPSSSNARSCIASAPRNSCASSTKISRRASSRKSPPAAMPRRSWRRRRRWRPS
ncbi:hypothetical protein LTR94_034542, partial [Friedmanniomyces endolithicus]